MSERVLVSNTASNMISSLHPSDTNKMKAALSKIKSSVLNSNNVEKIDGIDNAFVARAGDLRVLFKKEDGLIVVTSVLAPG